MTDAEFWSLIDTSRAKARGSLRRQERILEQLLRDLSADDVAEFSVRYDNLIRKAYHADLWAAAFLIGAGCSDDGFWDFRSWLVSRGKNVYRAALRNPSCSCGSIPRGSGRSPPAASVKSVCSGTCRSAANERRADAGTTEVDRRRRQRYAFS